VESTASVERPATGSVPAVRADRSTSPGADEMKKNVSLAALSLAAAMFATGALAGPEKTNKPQTSSHKQASTSNKAASGQTIFQTAQSNGQFHTFTDLMQKSGLDKTLNNTGSKYTVFAPTDEAFKALGTETLANLAKPENSGLLNSILKYHVVLGNVSAKEFKTGLVPTLNGQRFDISNTNGKFTVNKANVSKTDITCANGVIHVIDAVVLPNEKDVVATAVSTKLKTFSQLVVKADLGKTFTSEGNFTIFAPSDEAFAKLGSDTIESLSRPENKAQLTNYIKSYAVSNGRIFSDAAGKAKQVKTLCGTSLTIESRDGSFFVNGSKVVKADVNASNGVIHVIDTAFAADQANANASSNSIVGN
jgi:uncharacterized surface protein with fasciclin (FAS1) repeats